MDEIKGWLIAALDRLRRAGVDYADARFLDRETESITIRNEQVAALARNRDRGFGIRVLYKGSWGFAASAEPNEAEIAAIANRALEIAKASHLAQREPVRLDDSPPQVGSYRSPFARDPFAVPLDKKLELLFAAVKVLRQDKRVQMAEGAMRFFRTNKLFLSSEGAAIEQEIVESGAGIAATAVQDGEVQRRSYPNSFGGDFAAAGYEFVASLDLVGNAERTREEALALLAADPCPARRTDLIIDSSQLGLQVHESCGHPTELDRALGTEISYAGGSFLSLDKLGKFRYGSKIVNIYADATIPSSIGSFGYDDEGVKAQRYPLIKEGRFVGYLTSRETAPLIGRRSGGAMRAESWNHIPLIRMVNINLEPGEEELTLEDLIADTAEGVYVCTNKSWSIDDLRLNFQFGCELAWEIKHGKRVRPLKNPVYTGITPQFWGSCDAICDRREWRIWGLPNCGKGEPPQTMHVAHGAAPARFRDVEVGVQR
ncbi:MAG: TldD/PmbA family protein [Candidatus Acetothermia bacterium]|jgi:TldD protein|nr:TldD/PmbA family protein [Candidatus Acetothermia bacterium]MDH7505496.1 TldD/PmbA family protein [Candidatus Acetothermia bacterium]